MWTQFLHLENKSILVTILVTLDSLSGFKRGVAKMKNFRTYNLALQFYKDAHRLNLKEPMKSQFSRALLSIPLNLCEGSAKPTAKDRRKYYHIALGSMRRDSVYFKPDWQQEP